MRRRDFLKTVSAATTGLVVPRLKFQPSHDLHKLAKEFCDEYPGSLRYNLTEPFTQELRAFGTDGRAMLSFPCLESDSDRKTMRLPDAVGAIRTLWKERGPWRQLPAMRLLDEPGHCPECCLTQWLVCPDCDGEGEGEITYTDDDESGCYIDNCKRCKGTGKLTDHNCPRCHGTLYVDHGGRVAFGDKAIDVLFVRRLQRIPGIMWNYGGTAGDAVLNNHRHISDSSNWPILFKADGGVDGMVMPMARR